MFVSVKEKVLKILMESKSAVSGELLAKDCGVSRNAVWKAVNSLKAEGYDISGVNKSGYVLKHGDVLSSDELKCLFIVIHRKAMCDELSKIEGSVFHPVSYRRPVIHLCAIAAVP